MLLRILPASLCAHPPHHEQHEYVKKGNFSIRGAKVYSTEFPRRPFCFVVSHPHRDFFAQTEDNRDLKGWMEQLVRMIVEPPVDIIERATRSDCENAMSWRSYRPAVRNVGTADVRLGRASNDSTSEGTLELTPPTTYQQDHTSSSPDIPPSTPSSADMPSISPETPPGLPGAISTTFFDDGDTESAEEEESARSGLEDLEFEATFSMSLSHVSSPPRGFLSAPTPFLSDLLKFPSSKKSSSTAKLHGTTSVTSSAPRKAARLPPASASSSSSSVSSSLTSPSPPLGTTALSSEQPQGNTAQSVQSEVTEQVVKDTRDFFSLIQSTVGTANLREVINDNIQYLNVPDSDGRSPLHLAVSFDDLPIAAELVRSGAAVNSQDSRGWTPLHYVQSVHMLLLLLDKADLNIKTLSETSAFCHCLLLRDLTRELLDAMMKKGPDLHARNYRGDMPIHYAARSSEAAVLFLLEHGVDTNLQAANGDTPLHYAIHSKSSALALCLISHGADLDRKNKRGVSPHELAKSLFLYEIINAPQTLLKLYAEVKPQRLEELFPSLFHAEMSFLRVFFLTYSTCTTTSDLFGYLLSQFYMNSPTYTTVIHGESDNAQQVQIVNLLYAWVEIVFLDTSFLETDDTNFDDLFTALSWFCKVTNVPEHEMAAEAISALATLLHRVETKRLFLCPPGSQSLYITNPSQHGTEHFQAILQMSEHTLARCLTLVEHSFLMNIPSHEFLGQKWTGSRKSEAPNLCNYIENWNSISRWVSLSLLHRTKVKDRALLLVKWVKVAYICHQWRNYSTMNAILSSLKGQAIYRLRRTYALVPAHITAVLDACTALMSGSQNFASYRRMVAQAPHPCIPYLGVTLKDLTFIEDGNPDIFEDGKVNLSKNIRIYTALLHIFAAQKFPYSFRAIRDRSLTSKPSKLQQLLSSTSTSSPHRSPNLPAASDVSPVKSEGSIDADNVPILDASEFQGERCDLQHQVAATPTQIPHEARFLFFLPKITEDELFTMSLEREKRQA